MLFGIDSLAFISPMTNKSLDLIKKVADMGFDIFELAVEELGALDLAQMSHIAGQCGVRVELGGAFGPERDNSADEKEYRDNGLNYIKAMVDMAVELDSSYIMGPMYSAVGKARRVTPQQREQQLVWASENIRTAAEYAAKKKPGLMFGIEMLNRFETDLINTVEQAMELLSRIDMDNVGLLLDTFHMNIEEKDMNGAIRSAKGRIVDFHASANDRGAPGQDHIDWNGVRDALKDIGYDGPIVMESFTPDCVEIAKAASIWRPLAASPEALAEDGLRFLKELFA